MVTPVVVHGPGEADDAAAVLAASEGAAILAPPTGLMTLAALLSGARLFVGGDSGPLHLACGVGCPVVGIYGPTDPVVNTPWNVPFETVSPVGKRYTGIKSIDRSAAGFEGISDAMVARAVEAVLSRPRSTDQVLE